MYFFDIDIFAMFEEQRQSQACNDRILRMAKRSAVYRFRYCDFKYITFDFRQHSDISHF